MHGHGQRSGFLLSGTRSSAGVWINTRTNPWEVNIKPKLLMLSAGRRRGNVLNRGPFCLEIPDLVPQFRPRCPLISVHSWPEVGPASAKPGSMYDAWRQARNIEPMVGQCWADVVDGGPTLTQHWFNVWCLLGWRRIRGCSIIQHCHRDQQNCCRHLQQFSATMEVIFHLLQSVIYFPRAAVKPIKT